MASTASAADQGRGVVDAEIASLPAAGGLLGSGASDESADSRSRSTGAALSAASRSGCVCAESGGSDCDALGAAWLVRQLGDQISGGEATAIGSIFTVGAAARPALSPLENGSVSEKDGRPGCVGARELASLASTCGWRTSGCLTA